MLSTQYSLSDGESFHEERTRCITLALSIARGKKSKQISMLQLQPYRAMYAFIKQQNLLINVLHLKGK